MFSHGAHHLTLFGLALAEALAEFVTIDRIDILHLKSGGTVSLCVRLRLIHHRYQHATPIVSLRPMLVNPGSCLFWSRRINSKTAEPARSMVTACSITSAMPSESHRSRAVSHWKKRWVRSSGAC
jgi:hypothetical protein